MAIPTPPADASGGYIVLKYTDGTTSHRTRFHVLAFNEDATGTYVSPPAGGEASISATFAAVAAVLATFIKTTWTISLDAAFHIVGGLPVETFAVAAPATVAGTNAGAVSAVYRYVAFVMRTTGGKPIRFYLFQSPGIADSAPVVHTPNAGGDAYQIVCAYLQAAHTAIVGHDGNKPNGNLRSVNGINKRIRRKTGNA